MKARKKRATPPPPPKPTVVKAYSIAEDVESILQDLAGQATDEIGRPISSSTILRALVRHAGSQGAQWVRDHLIPLVEHELNAGIHHGKKKTGKL
jgi:hypothetical protein